MLTVDKSDRLQNDDWLTFFKCIFPEFVLPFQLLFLKGFDDLKTLLFWHCDRNQDIHVNNGVTRLLSWKCLKTLAEAKMD